MRTLAVLLTGTVCGFLLARLWQIADHWEEHRMIREVNGAEPLPFRRWLWMEVSNPVRPMLRYALNAVLGVRCADCGRILPGDSYRTGRCSKCYWSKVLDKARKDNADAE